MTEEIEQDEVVLLLALLQKGEGIGLMECRSSVFIALLMLEKLLINGQYLFVEVNALVAGIGPALTQMAGEIAATQPEFEDLPGLFWQQAGDDPLMGQTEGCGVGERHGGLHHAVYLQPAVVAIFLYREAALGFDAEVQQVIGLVRLQIEVHEFARQDGFRPV